MRAVLDTNVIVSAAISDTSKPAMVIAHWRERAFDLVMSDVLSSEYRRVLNYPHVRRAHNLGPLEVTEFVDIFDDADIYVEIDVTERAVPADPDDDIVVATAVAGKADFIVSGDRHLLELGEYNGIRIILPVVFLALLELSGDAGDPADPV